MSELYWIAVIGKVFIVAVITMTVSLIGFLICLNSYLDAIDEEDRAFSRRYVRRAFATFIVSAMLAVFVPSTSDMYTIYGVGSVIEYVKSSDEAKKLPDNAIKALNHYLEEINDKDE